MPDDELFELARVGRLQNQVAVEAQAQRMLGDPRSIELAESFYVQWLRLPEFWSAQPDKKLFPEFYSDINDKRTLAQDMFGEALLLFQTILVEDRPVTDLLDSDYTFVNGKLAQLYGRSHEQLQRFSDGANVSVLDLEEDRVWSRVRKVRSATWRNCHQSRCTYANFIPTSDEFDPPGRLDSRHGI